MSKNIGDYFGSSADFVATYNQFIEDILDEMVENISVFSTSVREQNEMDSATRQMIKIIKEHLDASLKDIANAPVMRHSIKETEQKEFRIQAKALYKEMRISLIDSINDKVIGSIKGALLNKFNLSADTLETLSVKTEFAKNAHEILSCYKSLTLLDDYFIELHNALSRYQPDTDIPALGTNEVIKATALTNLTSKHYNLLFK